MPKPGLPMEKFNLALQKYADQTVPKIAKDAQRIIAEEIYKRILQRTPVLTGRARRNWFPSFNTPRGDTTEDVAGVRATGSPITGAEKSRIAGVVRNIEFGPLGGTIWVTNNLNYIGVLESGSSAKAPNGIMEGAILGALEEISSRGIKVRVP